MGDPDSVVYIMHASLAVASLGATAEYAPACCSCAHVVTMCGSARHSTAKEPSHGHRTLYRRSAQDLVPLELNHVVAEEYETRKCIETAHRYYAGPCTLLSEGPADGVPGQQEWAVGAQQLMRRKGDDTYHADMLSSFDHNTTQGQRDAARLRSSSAVPTSTGAFLTAIPGGHMTFGNYMFVASVWHRLGHHVPPDVALPPRRCSAGVAAKVDHAMVRDKVAKMTQMRHNNLANALRLVFSACSCQSAAEPPDRALAGKKGMVDCQRQGDIVAVLPRLALAAVDVLVVHASAKSYAAQAAKTSGWTAAKAERTKRTQTRNDVSDNAALSFVPFAVETCGYEGKEAVKFVNGFGDIAADSGNPKGAFVRWAMLLQVVTAQWGNAEMYRRSGLIISREQGLRYDAGFAVPVLMS